MAKLGEVCEVLDSKRVPITAANRVSGQYPYYGANGVQDYVADYIFDDELVLLAEDGGNFGSKEKPIAYRVSGKCWVNNHAHVLKPKAVIDVDYLCYSLMFYDVSGLVNGATRQKLTQSDMRKMEIPLRTMVEQKKIVCRLNKLTELISLRKQQLTKLDELVKARFVEMFGDPVYNEMHWETKRLIDICRTIVDCPHSTPHYTTKDTGYKCIRTSAVKKNKILWEKVECISKQEYEERIKRKRPEKGDVIYTREGAILGIAAVIDRDYNVALGQRSMLLSPDIYKCTPCFLSMAMNFDSFLGKALGGVSGSASPHINVGDIKALEIIAPPSEIQNQFSTFVEQVDQQKQTVQQSLEKLELLKKALMQEYFG
jgi:type I restriction enzyme S subunit